VAAVRAVDVGDEAVAAAGDGGVRFHDERAGWRKRTGSTSDPASGIRPRHRRPEGVPGSSSFLSRQR
jgi:hypothetical protein